MSIYRGIVGVILLCRLRSTGKTLPLAAVNASQRQHGMYLVISDEISIFESPERSCSLHFCRLILGGRDRNHQRRWRLDGVDARRARHVAPPTIMWLICQRRRLPKVASQCSIAQYSAQCLSKCFEARPGLYTLDIIFWKPGPFVLPLLRRGKS